MIARVFHFLCIKKTIWNLVFFSNSSALTLRIYFINKKTYPRLEYNKNLIVIRKQSPFSSEKKSYK